MPNKYNIKAKRQVLDNLIRERAWKSFQTNFTLSHGIDDAKSFILLNTTHRTLLHSLCDVAFYPNPLNNTRSSTPSSELIYIVAFACPQALLLQHGSKSEQTPLHIAISQEAPLLTIKALLKAADDAKNINKQDLLLALDSKGRTPLLAAVQGNNMNYDDIVRCLVDQDVSGRTLLISSGKKKKQRQNTNVPLKHIASRESRHYFDFGLDADDDMLRFMIIRTYNAKLKEEYMSKASNDSQNAQPQNDSIQNGDGNETCLLQATIFCYQIFGSAKVASSILSYIIRNGLYHQERLHSQRDSRGNLTLHIACLSDTVKYDQILKLGDRETSYGLNSEDSTIIQYLIQRNPQACTEHNDEGDTPLHCAIKSGKDWSLIKLLIDAYPSSVQCCTSKGELGLHLAIKNRRSIQDTMSLWKCYPESASILDMSTGLFPFQLAAIFGSNRQNQNTKNDKQKIKAKRKIEAKKEKYDDMDETSLCYFLLRECPSVLSPSVSINNR